MLADSSTMLMDAIMSSKDEDMRGRLLKLIQEFLLSQLTQHAEKQRSMI
jgi:cohesin loading factor subunit SCC2